MLTLDPPGVIIPSGITILIALVQDEALFDLAEVMSPKSAVFPNVLIVTNDIVLYQVLGDLPPANIPRVGELPVKPTLLVSVMSPKLTPFPVDSIVTYSIELTCVWPGIEYPPANIDRVRSLNPCLFGFRVSPVKSPKS